MVFEEREKLEYGEYGMYVCLNENCSATFYERENGECIWHKD